MLIFILLLVFFAYASWKVEKSLISPSVMFATLWLIIIFLYNLKLENYFDVRDSTVWIIIIGVFSFFLGGCCSPKGKPKFMNTGISITSVFLLQIISILVFLPDAVEAAAKLSSGMTLQDLRADMDFSTMGRTSGQNGVLSILKNFILTPFMYLSYPLVSYVFVSSIKRDKISKYVLYLEIIIIAISIVRLGGRIQIFYFLFSFLTIYLYLKNRITLSSRVQWSIHALLIIAAVSFFTTSVSRGITDVPMSFYSYLTCCVPMLDIGLQNETLHTFGAMSLAAPLMLFDSLFRFLGLGGLSIIEVIYKMLEKTQETVIIGNGISSNAFYSLFYWFYHDFGILGVAIMSFLYGIIAKYFYNVVKAGYSPWSLIIYALILQGVAFSFIRFQFATNYYFYSFLLIPIFLKHHFPK